VPEEENIRIKDYQIHFPPLGEGAYGRVFRATYRGISERALKIFRPGAVDLSNMARELEKLSQVTEHQGIVTLHDFDLLNEPPYYAMGLHADQGADNQWDTRTLERLCGHVDHREGWRLIRQIADALGYLHRNQIVHCDIKPSNILLTNETPFNVKICDFGQSRGLTAEGFEPVGTPLYASPEQLRDPRDSADGKGFRWDVYSFGVVAYKLLTGNLPRLEAYAEAEIESFDLDSTLTETTLEATLAETGNAVDGEQLATMTEAVEDIDWPSDFYVPSNRKELIEQCLQLDPQKRPADMREVWSRIQGLDQQQIVSRARRLNTIFATLLVVAIWASGFAFVQAQKAKKATEVAMSASEESEQRGEAAMELMLLFVSELNKGDISGAGADRLYSIVAENSATFLDSRSKGNRASTRILRFSAQTASLQGRQALDEGNIEEALKRYQSAYEIRSQLAEDPNAPDDLSLLASRDLMEIGKIHEENGDLEDALSSYNEALRWRTINQEAHDEFQPKILRELSETHKAIARAHFANGDSAASIASLNEMLTRIVSSRGKGAPIVASSSSIEEIGLLEQKAVIQQSDGDLDAASDTYERIMSVASGLDEAPPGIVEKAANSYVLAVDQLAEIQKAQDQPEAALVLYREEIKLREKLTLRRPYDPDGKILLADAYAKAADCLTPEEDNSRLLAIFYLEQAVSMISRLPSEIRNRPEVQSKAIFYNGELSKILEAQE